MSNEQNIGDMLNMLKSSVSNDGYSQKIENDDRHADDISDEVLQSRLKMQYLGFADTASEVSDDEDLDTYNDYSIDDEFLSDITVDEESDEPELDINEPSEPDAIADEEILPEPEPELVLESEPMPAYDEADFFSIPDELEPIALTPEILEDDEVIITEEESEEDEDDGMIPLVLDDEPLTSDDFEMFDEPATFELYNADAVDSGVIYADESGAPVASEPVEEIVIDSTETSKALDFDVYVFAWL